jgi:hypothetical protein
MSESSGEAKSKSFPQKQTPLPVARKRAEKTEDDKALRKQGGKHAEKTRVKTASNNLSKVWGGGTE